MKKGNQWYFGMKAHVGVDKDSGLVHTLATTSANESDISQAGKVLHGEEKEVHGDSAHTGIEKREEFKDKKDVKLAMQQFFCKKGFRVGLERIIFW